MQYRFVSAALFLAGLTNAAPPPANVDYSYTTNAIKGLNALQGFYNNETGLWNTCGWWNAVRILFSLVDSDAVS